MKTSKENLNRLLGLGIVQHAETAEKERIRKLGSAATDSGFYLGNPAEDMDIRPKIKYCGAISQFGFYDQKRLEERGFWVKRKVYPLAATLTIRADMVFGWKLSLNAYVPDTKSEVPRIEALVAGIEKALGKEVDCVSIYSADSKSKTTLFDPISGKYKTETNPDYNQNRHKQYNYFPLRQSKFP